MAGQDARGAAAEGESGGEQGGGGQGGAQLAGASRQHRSNSNSSSRAAGQSRETEFTVYIRGQRYNKLELIGRGGSSKVYKVTILAIPATSALPSA